MTIYYPGYGMVIGLVLAAFIAGLVVGIFLSPILFGERVSGPHRQHWFGRNQGRLH